MREFGWSCDTDDGEHRVGASLGGGADSESECRAGEGSRAAAGAAESADAFPETTRRTTAVAVEANTSCSRRGTGSAWRPALQASSAARPTPVR